MVHVGKECLTKAYQLSTEGRMEEAKEIIKNLSSPVNQSI